MDKKYLTSVISLERFALITFFSTMITLLLYYVLLGRMPFVNIILRFSRIIHVSTLLIASFIGAVMYTAIGLLVLSFIWERIPTRLKTRFLIPLWILITFLISVTFYAISGFIYELKIYPTENPFRVFKYAFKVFIGLTPTIILGLPPTLMAEYIIVTLMSISRGHEQ